MRCKLNICKFFIIFIIFIVGCDKRPESNILIDRYIEYAKDDETKICFVHSKFNPNYFEVVPCSQEVEDKIKKSNAKK